MHPDTLYLDPLAMRTGSGSALSPSLARNLFLGSLVLVATVLAVMLGSLPNTEKLVPVSADAVLRSIPLALLAYFGGLFLVWWTFGLENRAWLFSLAFLLRVVTSAALLPLFQYDDEIGFHRRALYESLDALRWRAGRGYYQLNDVLYSVFGPSFLLPRVVNVLCGSLLPFLAYDIARTLFGSAKVARRAFWFTVVLPPALVFSSVNLKEIGTCLLLTSALWSLVCRRTAAGRAAGVAVSTFGIYWLRGPSWVVVPITSSLAYLLFGSRIRLRDLFTLRFAIRAAVTVVLVVVAQALLAGPVNDVFADRLAARGLASRRFVGSGATVTQFMDRSNLVSLSNFVVLLVRSLYSPSPLRVFTNFAIPTVIEMTSMVAWYLLFPFAAAAAVAHARQGAAVACSVTVFGVLAMAAEGFMLGGDPYRHRFNMMVPLFVLAAAGLSMRRRPLVRWIVVSWWLGAAVFTCLWLQMSTA